MKHVLLPLTVAMLTLGLCSCSKKEDQLADRIEKLEKVMKSNMDDPKKGVEKMIAMFEKEGPETVELLMELGIELARIEGEGDREKRLKEIQKTLETPMKNLAGTMEKFEDAAKDNKAAQRAMEDYMERWTSLGSLMDQFSLGGF